MQEFLLNVISHPFTDMKIVLSIWGAFGVIVFFWGFTGYFLSHGHIEHQDHARAYMVWGIILTFVAFMVWEGIRFIAGFFTGASYSGGNLVLGFADILLLLFFIVSFFVAKPSAGGH